MGSSLAREAVKLRIAPAVRFPPVGFDKPSILQSMQSWIQRTAWHLHNVAGDLLQPLRNGVAMDRLNGDNFQDEKV